MKVTLPAELEKLVNEKLSRGEFESADAAVAHAVRQVLGENGPARTELAEETRPIWEVIEAIMSDVPPEEFAKLPRDGASQVDHYVYGLPKRKK